MRAGLSQIVAQAIRQAGAGFHLHCHGLSVEFEFNFHPVS
jgi:hypothetical protein